MPECAPPPRRGRRRAAALRHRRRLLDIIGFDFSPKKAARAFEHIPPLAEAQTQNRRRGSGLSQTSLPSRALRGTGSQQFVVVAAKPARSDGILSRRQANCHFNRHVLRPGSQPILDFVS